MRWIDPVWVMGHVPKHFWEDLKNRRNYLLWLGHRLGYRRMEDFYRISHNDVKRNHGAGLAVGYWHASAIEGVKECFPDYDWKDWLFVTAPRSFWHVAENHRRYMDWLGEQLNCRRPEDWYRVTTEDFANHSGGAFLVMHHSSVSAALRACYPEYEWKEWMFRAPNGFWKSRKNRIRYMQWLRERLGYTRLDDCYKISLQDFVDNFGHQFMKHYHCTPALAIMDLIPRREWHEWRFTRVPCGFWDCKENRLRYMKWLGKQLGFRCPKDWYRIRKSDFARNCGGTLAAMYGSYFELLREFLPDMDWDPKTCRQSASEPG